MKSVYFIIFCLFPILGFSQVEIRRMKVGDTLPSVPLGKVMDNHGNVSNSYIGKHSFSEFKGKLVILDYWATYCAPCIRGFDKLSKLQEQFKDKIQIFLVNSVQNEEIVKKWLEKINAKRDSNIIPSNLPMLVDAKDLKALFPAHGEIGYHVWIDGNGIVQLRGVSENTHAAKITDLLNGRAITFVEDNALKYNYRTPYFLGDLQSKKSIRFSSAFGLFNDEDASAYGAGVRGYIDSLQGTKRSTYLNYSIKSLYDLALNEIFNQDSAVVFGDRVIIESSDSSLISQDRKYLGREVTDADLRNSICYEQIVPIGLSELDRSNFMLDDLNKYLFIEHKIQGKWEEITMPCYLIEAITETGISTSKQKEPVQDILITDDGISFSYKGYLAHNLFKDYFDKVKFLQSNDVGTILIAPEILEKKIDLLLPDPRRVDNIIDLKRELDKRGFSLKDTTEKVKFFVIRQL